MENLHNLFIPYEQALLMKELGFNEPCFSYYLEDGTQVPASYSKEGIVYPSNTDLLFEWCTAPTFSQAFKFFREKGYDVKVEKESKNLYFGFYWTGAAWIIVGEGTYEQAELECLKKLIEVSKIELKLKN
jgi:hypothetical protein